MVDFDGLFLATMRFDSGACVDSFSSYGFLAAFIVSLVSSMSLSRVTCRAMHRCVAISRISTPGDCITGYRQDELPYCYYTCACCTMSLSMLVTLKRLEAQNPVR